MASTAAPILMERADVHKSCKSLEAIVSVLVTYTEAANALANVQKKLAKALKEVGSMKGTNGVAVNAMITSAGIFESLAEVDLKFSKIADKEVETVSSDLRKWFKKLSKEEKAHDERISNLNARIKLAGQAYEKKAKKKDRDAVEEHSRYVAILNSTGPEMSKDNDNHTLFVTQRHTTALSGFAACVSRLAEAEWVRACELVRKSAPSIGAVGEWRVLCEGGWLNSMPDDLPDLSTNDGFDDGKIHASLVAPMPSLPIAPGGNVMSLVNPAEDTKSLHRSLNPKVPDSTLKTNALKANGSRSGVEQLPSYSTPSHPLSPPHEVITDALQNNSLASEFGTSTSSNKLEDVADSNNSAISSSTRSLSVDDSSRLVDSSPVTGSAKHLSNLDSTDNQQRTPENPEFALDHTIKLETKAAEPLSSQSVPPGPDIIPNEKNQLEIAKKLDVDVMNERELESQTASSPKNIRALEGERVVGEDLHRRSSVESGNSLVAAMRERYAVPPMIPSSPPPRDLPRLSQKVSDLATRYTPVDMSKSPPRNGSMATQSGLSADRFPTFQDKYPQSFRDRDRFKVSPVSSTPGRDHFDDRGKARYTTRYAESPTVDRNQFLRDGRGRSPHRPPRSRSPDQDYYDELGVLDQHRIESAVELSLQEREANLREQERRLEIDRARLANAREVGFNGDTHTREGGYTSDSARSFRGTSPYERPRRSKSPGPMVSQKSLPQYDLPSPYEQSRRSESPSPMTYQQSLRPHEYSRPSYGHPGRSESPSPMTSQQSLRPYEHSPYERSRRSESPSPRTSQQSLRPYDHSPNCGCQRCSAQFYASTTLSRPGRETGTVQQQAIYKPDSSITRRSEKPKGWLRRMSMPLVPSGEL